MRNEAIIRGRQSIAFARLFAYWLLLLAAGTATAASNPNAVTVRPAATEKTGAEKATCFPPAADCVPRTEDEVWCISTRCLGCPDCNTAPNLGVCQFDCHAGQWNQSSLADFLANSDAGKPTVFWVHGNRLEDSYVRSQGLNVYHQLTQGVSGALPIRFVIFSWPADITPGLVEDARRKAGRTNVDGYYLAWLVSQIDPHVTVDFVGHSFGARIVSGSLHLLGGGNLMGRSLPKPAEKRAPMKAVLLAAAFDSDWLAIGRPHSEALSAVDRMLAMNNHCDRALKRYPKLFCTSALGYTGAYGPLGDDGSKLFQGDNCCLIGKSHDWESYFYTPNLVWQMRPYLGLSTQ